MSLGLPLAALLALAPGAAALQSAPPTPAPSVPVPSPPVQEEEPVGLAGVPVEGLPDTLRLIEVDHPEAGRLRTGSFEVLENRAAGAGLALRLHVVVVRARSDEPLDDPVVVFGGGPGQDITEYWQGYVDWPQRRTRDVILLSQRGTGGDNRLACDLDGSADDLQAYFDPIFMPQVFRDCLTKLSQDFDLTQYSTAQAADDLANLLDALGVERVNVMGGSYGSRAALVFMRRHPERVRTAILNGLAPLAFTNPLYHASAAQRAVDLICAECAADPACDAAYPDLPDKLREVLARLDEEAAQVELTNGATGEAVHLTLDRAAFAESLRVLMYYDSRDIPALIEAAHRGDMQAFAAAGLRQNQVLRGMLPFGMLLSVTCAEDVDRIDLERIEELTADTFLGDDRVRQQMAVCEFWPRSELPEGFSEAVSVDIPTLLLSGRYDPVTSPEMGELTASNLPDSLHLVVPGSHGVRGPCLDSIQQAFLERGSLEGLDTNCVQAIALGPFRLPGQ